MRNDYRIVHCTFIFTAFASSVQNTKGNSSRYVITAEEIMKTATSNAYEDIQSLPPHLLNFRVVEPLV